MARLPPLSYPLLSYPLLSYTSRKKITKKSHGKRRKILNFNSQNVEVISKF
jgi:hypothetical protein